MNIAKIIKENMEKNSRHPELVEKNERILKKIEKKENQRKFPR
ncbi:hypothetical protein [Sporolactobacillus pectinivorans]|nr:hypothetical protein [Sporolactobacillus pectinivorans]